MNSVTLLLAGALLTGCTASTESTEVGVRTVNVSLFGPVGVRHDIYPQGQTYFFCSKACKDEFEADPEEYTGGEMATGT